MINGIEDADVTTELQGWWYAEELWEGTLQTGTPRHKALAEKELARIRNGISVEVAQILGRKAVAQAEAKRRAAEAIVVLRRAEEEAARRHAETPHERTLRLACEAARARMRKEADTRLAEIEEEKRKKKEARQQIRAMAEAQQEAERAEERRQEEEILERRRQARLREEAAKIRDEENWRNHPLYKSDRPGAYGTHELYKTGVCCECGGVLMRYTGPQGYHSADITYLTRTPQTCVHCEDPFYTRKLIWQSYHTPDRKPDFEESNFWEDNHADNVMKAYEER